MHGPSCIFWADLTPLSLKERPSVHCKECLKTWQKFNCARFAREVGGQLTIANRPV
jgi:hypothetical protein